MVQSLVFERSIIFLRICSFPPVFSSSLSFCKKSEDKQEEPQKAKSASELKLNKAKEQVWFKKTNYVCVLGGKKCSFFRKFDVLFYLETPVLRFTLLPYYRQNNTDKNLSEHAPEIMVCYKCSLITNFLIQPRFPKTRTQFLCYNVKISFHIYIIWRLDLYIFSPLSWKRFCVNQVKQLFKSVTRLTFSTTTLFFHPVSLKSFQDKFCPLISFALYVLCWYKSFCKIRAVFFR